MIVDNVMSKDVKTIPPAAFVNDAAKQMADHVIGVLPVANGDKLVGMVTDRDITTRCCARARTPFETLVREIMTEEVYFCRPDANLAQAMASMAELQVRRLPVINHENEMVGIISLSDIALKGDIDTGEAFKAISSLARERSPISRAERLF